MILPPSDVFGNEPLPASQYKLSEQEVEAIATARAFRSPLLLAQRFDKSYQAAKHLNVIDWEFRNLLVDSSIDILILSAPVRHGKSLYLSKWAPTWYHLRHPYKNTITTSHTSSMALSNSAWVRDKVHELCPLVDLKGVDPGKSAKSYWGLDLPGGGECRAAGVGGAITGFSANLLLIDDFLKDAKAAYSKGVRDQQWDWFMAAASTRLEPGGKCVMLSCLVGETLVHMADGTVKQIKHIKKDDVVKTFDQGNIGTSKVVNHAKLRHDDVFCVRLASGKTVIGNERHPFLIEKDGVLQWTRLRSLSTGNSIIVSREFCAAMKHVENQRMHCSDASITTTRQDAKARLLVRRSRRCMKEKHANGKDAKSQQSAGVTAGRTTARREQLMVTNRRANVTQTILECITCDTGMGYHQKSLMQCLNHRMEDVPCVEYLQITLRTGAENICASTTAMTQKSSEVCYVMPAISQPDMLSPVPPPLSSLNTLQFMSDPIVSITHAGSQVVYDLEVEKTGSFIANGMVTHNTRWHPDDLIGRILKNKDKYGLRVRSVTLPALKEDDGKADPCGRKPGEALWPERWPVEVLERRKKVSSIWWSALYQGRPASEGTNEFPEEYFKNIWLNDDEWPEQYPLLSASYLDPSKAKNDKRDDYQALVYVGYHNGKIIVDADLDRIPVTKMLRKWVQWDRERRPKISGCEGNAFQELLIGEYCDVCREEGYNHDTPECIINTIAKLVRIRRVGPWLSRGLLKFRRNRSTELLIEQLKEFPNGGKDDGPDALDGALRLLLKLLGKEFEDSVTETQA